MTALHITTEIEAPIDRVFDLSRSIDLHIGSQSTHRERAVAGRTSGLITLGETVTWSAVHFGIRQRLTTRISAMEPPHFFRDSQERGIFKRFDHDHLFEHENGITVMTDVFDFDAPLGPLGRLAERLVLKRYMTRLLGERNTMIKTAAETDLWQRFLSNG